MYRNTTVGFLPLGLSRRLLASSSAFLIALCAFALFGVPSLHAQVAGSGEVSGVVTDKTGAVVPNAEVTATNTETGVQTTRKSTSTGQYSISPLQAGNYVLEVVAKGFNRLLQDNVQVNSTENANVPLKLTVGSDSQTITITDAPPYLDTTSATLGGTIENELYTNLPLSMNAGPRDPTQFQYLMPGVQEGPPPTSSGGLNQGIYGGSGQQNLNENYIEGMPVSNIQSQGDNSPVAKAVSADAVDQFSVQTNGASSAFGGVGVTNFTIKSGGNQFHGTVFDFIRNTAFDSWGYFSKVPSGNGYAEKPGEHQNSYGASLGGPIIKDKLFFFGTYEGFSYTKLTSTPQFLTIPTVLNRQGNFTDDFGTTIPGIFSPLASGNRQPFNGNLNGVPTFNVVPQSSMSPSSVYWASALPAPISVSTINNYLGGLPVENKDYTIDARIDYTITPRQKFSIVAVGGNRGFGGEPDYSNTTSSLPQPYAAGSFTNQKTASGILSYVFVISQTLINSLKYGYTRTWGENFSISNGTPYNASGFKAPASVKPCFGATSGTATCADGSLGANTPCTAAAGAVSPCGILGLPAGNASQSMPAVSFSQGWGTGAPTPANFASSGSSGPQATNTYTAIDQLQWIKGKHNLTFGLQVQWLEANGPSGTGTPSGVLNLTANGYDTSACPYLAACLATTSFTDGSAYASYLVGAFYSGSLTTQSVSDYGGRFRPDAIYVDDNWRFSPKLTLTLGLRYDYYQPYHEVKNRIVFLKPSLINPLVGIPGVEEYAGFTPPNPAYAPYTCYCTTPVKPYNLNFEPRLGFAYAATPTFVLRGSYGMQLTHAGGSGGGGTAVAGTGNNSEFATSSSPTGGNSTGVPSFFLNANIPSTNTGISNTNPSPNYQTVFPFNYPGAAVNPLEVTGNYNFQDDPATGGSYTAGGGSNIANCVTGDGADCNQNSNIPYADPYYGGRGPEFINWNLSIQQLINKKAVLNIAYAGSETHFLGGGAGRGPATNTISPDYGQLLRNSLGNPAGTSVAAVQTVLPNYKLPYPNFTGPAASATVFRSLSAFPQFGSFTDIWGDTGNSSSQSLQIGVIQRPWHNLSGFANYTRYKNLDDTHGHRTQYPVGPQDGNFTKNYVANDVDRGYGLYNQTNGVNVALVYNLPIGRGQTFFATNRIMGLIGGGWNINTIYKYRDGYPIRVSNGGGCNTNTYAGQGTCMPDYAPGFDKRTIRINGRWGRGPGVNSQNLASISYINSAAFVCPDSPANNPTSTCGATTQGTGQAGNNYKLGNIASSAPDGLTGPGYWDIDLGIRRTFTVIERPTLHLSFQLEADATNVTNSTFFNTAQSASWDSSGFGTVTGQNQAVTSRDWQFAGRFRF